VRIEDLDALLRNPARLLLRRRLRVQLEPDDALLEDTEAFALDGLGRYALRRDVYAQVVAGRAPEAIHPVVRAAGLLPGGAPGDVAFAAALEEVTPLAARFRAAERHAPVVFDLAFGAHRLTGSVRPGDWIEPAGLTPARRLAAWVRHLALHAAGVTQRTAVYTLDPVMTLAPLTQETACTLLRDLVALYGRALTEPLRLFPRTSYAHAACVHAGKGDARKAALRAWLGNEGEGGERDDPCFALVFRHVETPLDGEFASLAEQVWRPLLDACASSP
jgi:exodeoxyribonuclease V gamma subunit